MSCDKSSLRGGKKLLRGGWSRPLPTSVGRTLPIRTRECAQICASMRVLTLARRGRVLHARVNVQATRVTSLLLALVCQVSCDLYYMYEHRDSWTKLFNNSCEYDRKPSLEENSGKMVDSFGARFGQGRDQESEPVPVEHRNVEYSRSHAVGYPKIVW